MMKKNNVTTINIKDAESIQDALDNMGLALANAHHVWTNTERRGYERATRILKQLK